MCKLALALLLFAWSIAAMAAEQEQGSPALKFELLSFQTAAIQGDNPSRRPIQYRFSAGLVLTDVRDLTAARFIATDVALLRALPEAKREVLWQQRENWPTNSARESLSLSPLLSFGTPMQKLEIRPRRHSIAIQFRQGFN